MTLRPMSELWTRAREGQVHFGELPTCAIDQVDAQNGIHPLDLAHLAGCAHASEPEAYAAAVVLGALGRDDRVAAGELVELLAPFLSLPLPRVRAQAAQALTWAWSSTAPAGASPTEAGRGAVELLAQQLAREPHPDVRTILRDALHALGAPHWTPLYPCDAVFVDGLCTARDARRLRDALLPPPRGAEEARRAYADELAEAMLAQGARTFEVEPKYVDAFLASLMAGPEE